MNCMWINYKNFIKVLLREHRINNEISQNELIAELSGKVRLTKRKRKFKLLNRLPNDYI